MNRVLRTGIAAALLSLGAAGCCVTLPTGLAVHERPPRPLSEEIHTAPSPGHEWIPGYWAWQERWVWEPGQWVLRPHPEARWEHGYWAQSRSGWFWVSGYWRQTHPL